MRRTTVAAIAALLVTGLAACGTDATPKFAKPGPASPSVTGASPTASVSAPTMPATAVMHTVSGAQAFAAYLIAAANYGSVAEDPSLLQSVSGQHCDGCQSAISFIEDLATKKARVHGGVWASDEIRVKRLTAGSQQLMQVTVDGHTSRQVIVYPNGKRQVYRATPAITVQLILLPEPEGWVVDRWDVQ